MPPSNPFTCPSIQCCRVISLRLPALSLSSIIPPILASSHLDHFNVSGNSLNGSITQGLVKFGESTFNFCGKPLTVVCSQDVNLPTGTVAGGTSSVVGGSANKRKWKLSGGAIAGIAIGCALGFFLLVALLICLYGRKGEQELQFCHCLRGGCEGSGVLWSQGRGAAEFETGGGYANRNVHAAGATRWPKGVGELEINGGLEKKLVFFGSSRGKAFDLEDLLRASAVVLGKGTVRTAYKAILEAGAAVAAVAMKRPKDMNIPANNFKGKIEGVERMEQENLLPLMASYYNNVEKILVY